MIDYLKGPVVYKDKDSFVIECGGVGLRVLSTVFSLSELEEGVERTVFTELVVREDSMTLVGFSSRAELDVYRMLVTVNGVGPKLALGALSSVRYSDLCLAIVSRDLKTIQSAQGIGKRTAERIVVDLSDKAAMMKAAGGDTGVSESSAVDFSEQDELLGALLSLGYKKAEAIRMISLVDRRGLSSEEALRAVLQEAYRS